uniref:WEB family protein At3g51720-like n=1 Tax=Erigeron canadensis TaxID=72917 RepID=UPI001CB9BC75|nr:WEB family protein At3g51720-like [Erigeron canadensis]
MGSELKENVGGDGGGWKAEVDTTAPFESVMEAVTRFGGIGYWKPHTRDPSQTTTSRVPDSEKVEDEATHLQNKVAEEKETREILKEIEATKTRFEELKVKLQKEEAKVDTHSSDCQSNDSDTAANAQVSEVELSKTEILKRVEEATEEVKHCTKVIEEALSRVNTCRQKSSEFENLGPPMSIGQILSRKLVLAEKNSAKSCMKWKVSLSQVLRKTGHGEKRGSHGGGEKRVPTKRMKFGFCV